MSGSSNLPNGDARERIAKLEAKVDALESMLVGQASWMSDLQLEVTTGVQKISGMFEDLASHHEWLTSLERWVSSCVKTLANFGAQPLDTAEPEVSGTLDVTGSLITRLQVSTVMDWISSVEAVAEDPLVSVTIATRNRPEMLMEAVDSVLRQSYQHFEIVVMDDSDNNDSQVALAGLKDGRIQVVRTPARRGAGATFNVGLEAATGEIVSFLDDDNLMHPEWLRSVVWAFTTFPEVGALYGARSNEDAGAQHGVRSGMLPTLEFALYDRTRHERANYIDRNTIAMRSAFRHIRYDESLRAAFDWDHSLRLFAQTEPLALPALSCYYRTIVADRVSDIPEQGESVRRVRSRVHASRPLRVLVHTAMYPVISETYIGEDIRALQRAGAIVSVSALQDAVSQAEGVPPARLDVDSVIEEHRPDVVLMHWATHAEGELGRMERHNLPFACRVHSFDVNREKVEQILNHPLCVSVFAHPHHLGELPAGVRPLLPTVDPSVVIPESPAERGLVLSVSAGLPKKDFGFLIETLSEMPELERMIILARSNGREDVPQLVERMVADIDPSIDVRINVPRSQVLEVMSRASVMVYTLAPEYVMGYPMSIIEAMLCGTIPVIPDRPEARTIVGSSARVYRDGAGIVRHVREVAKGGGAIQRERSGLVRLAQRHRDPVELVRLHDALRDGLTEWRAARA